MKHQLPNVPHYFKANLHTHTTVSDGKFTPEEVKEIYKSRGYQILAFTDHEKFISHQELNDTDFLALDSYELSITETDPGKKVECYHLNLFAKDPENPPYGMVCVVKGERKLLLLQLDEKMLASLRKWMPSKVVK